MTRDSQPLACLLTGTAFAERQNWLRSLKSRALLDHWREGRSLHLLFRKDARADVEALIAKETACCGFLIFSLSDTDQAVHLCVTSPPEASGFVDDLLRHFEPESTE